MKRLKQSLADIERNRLLLVPKATTHNEGTQEAIYMDIRISNCNSIDEANIKIYEGFLNIKFGVNGTGKSTISKAIELNANDKTKLSDLTPFKLLENNPNDLKPEVDGSDTISSVAVFGESYISQFVFRQDELIKNSFEIFVKNDEYQQKLEDIEGLVAGIKQTFEDDEDIDRVVNDLIELSGCFGKAKNGYSKASPIGKSIAIGNKIENIPDGLELYTDFLRSDQNTNWIKWQVNGNKFLELSDNCPYCISPAKDRHEDIKRVSDEFDANTIGHLTKVVNVVQRLEAYFSDAAREQILSITKNKIGLSAEDDTYLKQVKEQVDILKDKLINLQSITFFSFEDVDKVAEAIQPLKINLGSLPLLNSESTAAIVDKLNSSLDSVLEMVGPLQGKVNQQKNAISKTIESRQDEINEFLKFAGYKYTVEIEVESQQYKLKLLHHDMTGSVSGGSQHLSYGEKNAFALVLFMYECIANSPDLIVLDDPISSFDKNKKYALLDMLFTGAVSLKGKTVLMLTHDLEPIIDIVRTLEGRFSHPKPKASFLKAREGFVTEIEITKSDIKTFSQICDENITNNDEAVIKLIYLRRLYETIDDKGSVYQLLSNLLHKRVVPVDKSGEVDVDMTEADIASASSSISARIEGFDYPLFLARMSDKNEMLAVYQQCDSDYEKLQVFRIINEQHVNNVMRKYINESFHIENEFICQLNPCKFEVIPEFIVKECDSFFAA